MRDEYARVGVPSVHGRSVSGTISVWCSILATPLS